MANRSVAAQMRSLGNFEPYTTRVLTGRLAQAFDAALAKGN